MFRSHRESDRRVHLAALSISLFLLGGCASTGDTEATAEKQCPPGRALICTQRMGKDEYCVCEREEKFKDIWESAIER